MNRKRIVAGVALIALAAIAAGYWRRGKAQPHFTGFVEGEERVVRSEVPARILEIRFVEGGALEPGAVLAVLDDSDVVARINTQRAAVAALDQEIRGQQERVTVIDSTSARDLDAQRAAVREAESQTTWADKNFAREETLVKTGASTAQLLDDARSRRDQARSQLERARQMHGRAEAALGNVAVAREDLETLRKRRDQALAELAGLEVTHSKYMIRAPAVGTVVQTQYAWAGELAQPGSAIVSLIDPRDKYVQIYIPVADLERFRIGQRVEIELDSRPGHRVPGEVSFVADKATFTPEKIEMRSDRMGQVYRAKIRILQDVESFRPGTEGNVFIS